MIDQFGSYRALLECGMTQPIQKFTDPIRDGHKRVSGIPGAVHMLGDLSIVSIPQCLKESKEVRIDKTVQSWTSSLG